MDQNEADRRSSLKRIQRRLQYWFDRLDRSETAGLFGEVEICQENIKRIEREEREVLKPGLALTPRAETLCPRKPNLATSPGTSPLPGG